MVSEMCEEIKEIVHPEYKALEKFPHLIGDDVFERCSCGSSLFRIIIDKEKDGDDHCFVCAKDNHYIGGVFNRLKEPPEALCNSCKNKEKRWDEEPCSACKVTTASNYQPLKEEQ